MYSYHYDYSAEYSHYKLDFRFYLPSRNTTVFVNRAVLRASDDFCSSAKWPYMSRDASTAKVVLTRKVLLQKLCMYTKLLPLPPPPPNPTILPDQYS